MYRTAQEALTNVRRHARPAHVELACATSRTARASSWRTSAPTVTPGPSRVSASPAWATGSPGMRERAELLGGRLAAAPTDTGFRVELFIPEGSRNGG